MITESTGTARDIDTLAINTIRMLAADAVQRARSGHPGMPMGAAPMAYVLWTRHLRHNPANPDWFDRDRFVLSAGHGSMLLYALLHLTGYELSMDDLRAFRQWGSKTPGHPEYRETPGVETTTGPLGQGFGNAVGMAIAEKRLGAEFHRGGHHPVSHHTYVIASDGDLMEGVHAEAASLAGHLGLGRLIVLYDDNGITIDGATGIAFSEDVGARFEAYGWHTAAVGDGNDLEGIDAAIEAARAESERPSLIAVRTSIGYGSPNKQDTASAHGEPLGEDELGLTKANLGWPVDERFVVPSEVLPHFRAAVDRGRELEDEWTERFAAYAAEFPAMAAELQRRVERRLPDGWSEPLPRYGPDDGPLATRAASGKALNAVAGSVTELIGGSADLAGSNKTDIEGSGDFAATTPEGRNLRFGIREHAMGAIQNGLALHGGFIPYGGTFLIFSDYMRPSVRLAALMGLHTIYVYTHDSIGVGEDGPTHQPVEHVPSLRAMPGLWVVRPGDANETSEAWRLALERRDGPVALVLTRQKLPVMDVDEERLGGVARGAYVLADDGAGDPHVILIASGSEVSLVLEARATLAAEGVRARVVSMPCQELFDAQEPSYRDEVLPPGVRARLAVEAAATLGWSRYVGEGGDVIGIDRFGASAPGGVTMEKFGFTAAHVAERARALLGSDPAR